MTDVAQLPPSEVATILSAVCASKFPKGDLPTIAINHHLTLPQLQQLLRAHAYPDVEAMRRRVTVLLDQAAAPPESLAAAQLPLDKVLPDPENLREHLTGIDELADSIEAIGMLEPIVVRRRGDAFVVVAGHRRRAAAALLHMPTVPVVLADLRPADVLVAMLIENGQREDLDPIEEARGLERLRWQRAKPCEHVTDATQACDYDGEFCSGPTPLKHHAIAELIGRSQPYVSGRLALLELPPEEQEAIRAGHLGVTEGARRGRRHGGHHRPGAQGKGSAAHFDELHPLAAAARALCRQLRHSKHVAGGIIGHVACGACWEAAIRTDEGLKADRRRRVGAEVGQEPVS